MEYPKLEIRSAEEVATQAINDLPPGVDKTPTGYLPRFIRASVQPLYAAMIFVLNDVPNKIHLWLLNRLGIEPLAAVAAQVTVQFTAATLAGARVPAGTVVKNATGIDAHKFKTTATLEPADFSGKLATITAVCVELGSAPNALEAGTLTMLETPIAGIDSVTNPGSPVGGEDVEPWETFMERVPIEMRATRGPNGELMAITREDFWLIATRQVPGVTRCVALRCKLFNKTDPNLPPLVDRRGCVAMVLVDSNINAAPLPSVEADVVETLTLATVPGVTVTAHHPTVRRVYVQKVEVELEEGVPVAGITPAIKSRLSKILTAIDRINDDGKSIDYRGWVWGKSLYYNDLVTRIDNIIGVERVGRIWVQVSDDSGSSWSAPALLTEVKAGADGIDNADFGLLHWGEAPSYPFEVAVI